MNSPLEQALENYVDHPEFVGIKLTSPNQVGHTSETPLHIASRQGAISDVKVFLQSGADVNLRGDCGNTPLHEAALRGNEKVIQLLLENGANKALLNDFNQTAKRVAEVAKKPAACSLLS